MASKPPRLALKLSLATAILAAIAWALLYALRLVATVAVVYRGKAVDAVPGSVTSKPSPVTLAATGAPPASIRPSLAACVRPGRRTLPSAGHCQTWR